MTVLGVTLRLVCALQLFFLLSFFVLQRSEKGSSLTRATASAVAPWRLNLAGSLHYSDSAS